MANNIRITVFWGVTPCVLVDIITSNEVVTRSRREVRNVLILGKFRNYSGICFHDILHKNIWWTPGPQSGYQLRFLCLRTIAWSLYWPNYAGPQVFSIQFVLLSHFCVRTTRKIYSLSSFLFISSFSWTTAPHAPWLSRGLCCSPRYLSVADVPIPWKIDRRMLCKYW
jgi:hypothetical protein